MLIAVSDANYHSGGELSVRSAATSNEIVFDWSTSEDTFPKEVKWAAFYSDCEHEVHEVLSGDRITLTYNLFLTRGTGHLAGQPSVLDSTQLPLYEGLQEALDNPGFLRRGEIRVELCAMEELY